jgi:hypothetical protein
MTLLNSLHAGYRPSIQQGCTNFPKPLNIAASMVTCIKFRTEDPQMLGTTVPDLVAMAIRRPEFEHPWFTAFWDVIT